MKHFLFNVHIKFKITFIFLIAFLYTNTINSQTKDSLLSVLQTKQADTCRISTLFELATELYLSNPDTTIKICLEILDISEKINDEKNIAESYGWLGYLYANTGRNNKAIEYDLKAVEFLKKVNNQKSLAITYINIASIYETKGDIVKTLEYYDKSLEIQKKIGDKKGTAITLNNLAYVSYNYGDIEKAIEYWTKCLKIQKEVEDQKGIATSYINIGAVYSSQGSSLKAKSYYLKSLVIYQKLNDLKGQAIAFKNIGSLYFEDKNYTLAYSYFIKSLILHKKLKNQEGIAELYLNLANVNEVKNKLDTALAFTQNALNIYKLLDNKKGISSAYLELADIYFIRNNLSKALNYALISHSINEELGYPENINFSAKKLNEIYLALKDYENAYKFLKLEIAMHDSILNEKNYKTLIQNQTKIEIEKQQSIDSVIISNIKAENITRKRQSHLILLSSFIFAISFVISIIFYIQKNKRNKILIRQKHTINQKKEELIFQNERINEINEELTEKQEKLELAYKLTTNSIQYAKKIQTAAFPNKEIFENNFSEFFIIYYPLELLSGDFYWAKEYKNLLIFAVADSSGHGIPGAFVSMLGISILNEILFLQKINTAGEILDNIRIRIKESLNQLNFSDNEDSLDISLCIFDKTKNELQFAGAYNSLYIFSQKDTEVELTILKADRQPVGIFIKEHPFTNNIITLKKGDILYLFTDGFMDQFDKEVKSKFGHKRFRTIIKENYNKSITEQKEIIINSFEQWKGDANQVDDILVLGLKI